MWRKLRTSIKINGRRHSTHGSECPNPHFASRFTRIPVERTADFTAQWVGVRSKSICSQFECLPEVRARDTMTWRNGCYESRRRCTHQNISNTLCLSLSLFTQSMCGREYGVCVETLRAYNGNSRTNCATQNWRAKPFVCFGPANQFQAELVDGLDATLEYKVVFSRFRAIAAFIVCHGGLRARVDVTKAQAKLNCSSTAIKNMEPINARQFCRAKKKVNNKRQTIINNELCFWWVLGVHAPTLLPSRK